MYIYVSVRVVLEGNIILKTPALNSSLNFFFNQEFDQIGCYVAIFPVCSM